MEVWPPLMHAPLTGWLAGWLAGWLQGAGLHQGGAGWLLPQARGPGLPRPPAAAAAAATAASSSGSGGDHRSRRWRWRHGRRQQRQQQQRCGSSSGSSGAPRGCCRALPDVVPPRPADAAAAVQALPGGGRADLQRAGARGRCRHHRLHPGRQPADPEGELGDGGLCLWGGQEA